jgi:hypothetical protein
MRPDSSAILNALVAKLGADAPLLAHAPNGVYEDMGPDQATRFVVVSQVLSRDLPVFVQGRVIEDALFLVEARVLQGSGGDVRAAALRIDTILEDGTLTVPGYGLIAMHREEFIRGTEVDEVDPSIVWKRRGGRYRVQVYPVIEAMPISANEVYETHADRFGLVDFAIWFDGPLKIPDATNIRVMLISSDPARWPDFAPGLSIDLSDLNVADPAAPGRACLRWRAAFDMSTMTGMTFTLSDASPRENWSKILNRSTGEPVADTLGDVVLVIPMRP